MPSAADWTMTMIMATCFWDLDLVSRTKFEVEWVRSQQAEVVGVQVLCQSM